MICCDAWGCCSELAGSCRRTVPAPRAGGISDEAVASKESFQPLRQSITRRFARVDYLLSRQSQQLGDLRVLERRLVPHLGEPLGAHLKRLRQLAKRGDSQRRKQRDATSSFGVSQFEQQRHALLARKLSRLIPEPLKKDAFYHSPRDIDFTVGQIKNTIARISVNRLDRTILDLQQVGHHLYQLIELDRGVNMIEDGSQRIIEFSCAPAAAKRIEELFVFRQSPETRRYGRRSPSLPGG